MTQAPYPRRTTRAKAAEAPEEDVYHAEVEEEELEELEGGRRKRKQLKERLSAALATTIETISVCIS